MNYESVLLYIISRLCSGYEVQRKRFLRAMTVPTSEEERVGCDFQCGASFAVTVQPKRLRWQRGAHEFEPSGRWLCVDLCGLYPRRRL